MKGLNLRLRLLAETVTFSKFCGNFAEKQLFIIPRRRNNSGIFFDFGQKIKPVRYGPDRKRFREAISTFFLITSISFFQSFLFGNQLATIKSVVII